MSRGAKAQTLREKIEASKEELKQNGISPELKQMLNDMAQRQAQLEKLKTQASPGPSANSLVVGAVLSGCSYSQQKPLATRVKASVGCRPSGRRITYQGNGLVRVPDQTHIYKVGRLPDGDSMREAGNYY